MNSDELFSARWFREDAIEHFNNLKKGLNRGGARGVLITRVQTIEGLYDNSMSEDALFCFGFHRALARKFAVTAEKFPHGRSLHHLIMILIDLVRNPERHCYPVDATYLHNMAVSSSGTIDLVAKNEKKMRLQKYDMSFLQGLLLSAGAMSAVASLTPNDGNVPLFHGTTEYFAQLIVQNGVDLSCVLVPNDLDRKTAFYTTPDFRTAVVMGATKTSDFNDANPDQPQFAAVVVFYCPAGLLQGDKAFSFDDASPDWEKLTTFHRRYAFPPKPIYANGMTQNDFDAMHVISAPQVLNTNEVTDGRESPRPLMDGDGNLQKQVAFFSDTAINQLQAQTPLIMTFPVE